MTIYINDKIENISPEIVTVADLLSSRNIPSGGTAVAVNGRLVKQPDWGTAALRENDKVMIISAAYGG